MILFYNCQSVFKLNKLITAKTIHAMMVVAGYSKWDLTVSFIEDAKMKELNNRYREKDSSTDILSFPTHTNLSTPGVIPNQSKTIKSLGDIFISLPYVQSYCDENHIQIEEHLPVLYAHGISHLLGFDHETDSQFAVMDPYEKHLLKSYPSHMDEYDPLEEGLFESWNWSRDLNV